MIKRVLLKLSGESLAGGANSDGKGINPEVLTKYAAQIGEVVAKGVQVAIVIGGGNIFRGLSGLGKGVDRVKGDSMGMLATVINSLGLCSALEAKGYKAKVLTSIDMHPIAEHYSKAKAIEAMQDGCVVIVAGGTGNPYFTTDTASALRAIELECDYLLKGTRVDGVYSADPEKDPTATKYEKLTFDTAYKNNLKVMDLTSFTMCKENNMSIIVFDMDTEGNLNRVINGENIGTIVSN